MRSLHCVRTPSSSDFNSLYATWFNEVTRWVRVLGEPRSFNPERPSATRELSYDARDAGRRGIELPRRRVGAGSKDGFAKPLTARHGLWGWFDVEQP